jgi:hypothetical protein
MDHMPFSKRSAFLGGGGQSTNSVTEECFKLDVWCGEALPCPEDPAARRPMTRQCLPCESSVSNTQVNRGTE